MVILPKNFECTFSSRISVLSYKTVNMLQSLGNSIRLLQLAAKCTSSPYRQLCGSSKGFFPLSNSLVKAWRSTLPQPASSSMQIIPVRCNSIDQLHRNGPHKKKQRDTKKHMLGKPEIKGIVLKVVTRKPKKPNSANRRCISLRLSDGREVTAFVPGEGHNLKEHNVVLVEGGRTQDLIGVKHTVIRGKYDCSDVVKKKK